MLSECAAQVRRLDYDRYLTALFAPADRRESVFAIYAFNTEVARVRESVSEPMLGQIRLQWWREVVETAYGPEEARRHPVAEAVTEAIRRCELPRDRIEALIDGRERDLDETSFATLEDLVTYVDATAGGLAQLVLAASAPDERGGTASEAARLTGRAWALTGLLRSVPAHTRKRQRFIPDDVMAAAGAREADLFERRGGEDLAAACRRVADEARRALDAAREAAPKPSKAAMPALLPGVLARRYLARMAQAGHDPFARPVELGGPRKQLALMAAAWRRRI